LYHLCTVAASAAPLKHAGKVDQATSKPGGQSTVFVFQGSQAGPAVNAQAATARPVGMFTVDHLIVAGQHYIIDNC